MKHKLGIFSSATNEKEDVVKKAKALGQALREYEGLLKESKAKVFFETSPEILLEQIIKELKKRKS